MQLPIFQTTIKELSLLQTKWASILNPFISPVQQTSNILSNITLAIGSNTINHKLGHELNGWKVVRQRASAQLYDTQDSNQTPDLTLVLVSNAIVSIDLEVF